MRNTAKTNQTCKDSRFYLDKTIPKRLLEVMYRRIKKKKKEKITGVGELRPSDPWNHVGINFSRSGISFRVTVTMR